MSSRVVNSSDESDGEPTPPRTRYTLRTGQAKRSLSVFGNLQEVPTPTPAKRAREYMSDLDDLSDDYDDAVGYWNYPYDEEMEPVSPQVGQQELPVDNFAKTDSYRAYTGGVPVAKKIAIKNFRKRNAIDGSNDTASQVPKEWRTLEESILAIQEQRAVANSLEELFKTVVTVCDTDGGVALYNRLIELSRIHLSRLRSTLESERSMPGEDFLRRMNELWNNYCDQMMMVRNVFLHLDRTYVLSRPSVQSIWDASLTIYCDVMMSHEYVRERLIREILQVIDQERKGDKVDGALIRSLLRMLSNLQIYDEVFERRFLASTAELYGNEGKAFSAEMEISFYLDHVARRLREECERVDMYLDTATKRPLMQVVEQQFIIEHMNSFVPRGFDALMQGERIEDLSLLYTLLSRVADGPTLLRTLFTEYIKRHGKAMVMDKERDKTMVTDLMTFKRKLDTVVVNCFANSEKMRQAEQDSFDYFVNTRPNKPAELIAKFIDMKLRSGNKECSDDELDHLMDKVVTLFRFIQGKDVFEAFYKKDLAKRLLLSKSASVDAEKSMLSKLKQECGAGFTQKLEGMFKDMEISKDLANAYRQATADTQVPSKVDFSVNILTMGQWPNYDYAEATLPQELARCQQSYQEFYISKHNGRKLQWQHSLGQCLLKGKFRPGVVKELQVSLFQAIVLLLFNAAEEWSYEDILSATKIEKTELCRTLQSLACAKLRLLNKTPKGRDVEPGDKFDVNTQLNEKLYRIRVSQVQLKETPEEHKATEERVNQDRQYQIDAAIVRVMKTRKTLTHQALIQELFAQLRFPVTSVDLKTRIASLIEREYISRDSADPNTYNYVA